MIYRSDLYRPCYLAQPASSAVVQVSIFTPKSVNALWKETSQVYFVSPCGLLFYLQRLFISEILYVQEVMSIFIQRLLIYKLTKLLGHIVHDYPWYLYYQESTMIITVMNPCLNLSMILYPLYTNGSPGRVKFRYTMGSPPKNSFFLVA